MRTAPVLTLLFFFLISASNSFAQTREQPHAIQLAAYDSWEKLAKNEAGFVEEFDRIDWPSDVYTKEDVYVEKVGEWVKVYLLHDSHQALDLLLSVKDEAYFAAAYRKVNVNPEALITYGTAVRMNRRPSEYTAKGGTVVETADRGTYKIQLGAFKERKELTDLAKKYGFGEVDEKVVNSLVSHDFVSIKGKVYRRYYFGRYATKAEALTAMKYLEQKSQQKLMLVQE